MFFILKGKKQQFTQFSDIERIKVYEFMNRHKIMVSDFGDGIKFELFCTELTTALKIVRINQIPLGSLAFYLTQCFRELQQHTFDGICIIKKLPQTRRTRHTEVFFCVLFRVKVIRVIKYLITEIQFWNGEIEIFTSRTALT